MSRLVLAGGMAWDGQADHAERRDIDFADGVIAAGNGGDADVIDVSGCTVIPGLIDGHAHLCFDATRDWRRTYDTDSRERMLLRMAGAGQRMLAAGITTVRDLGAPTGLAIELRDAIRNGRIAGPDLKVAGAPITTTGGHCWFMGGEADGELAVRVAVRERVRDGCDWIKVMATGGNMTPRTNPLAAQYSVEELRVAVDEAHRLNRRVAAHCHGTAGIRVAVEADVDSIEHCSFTTENGIERDDALIEAIARKGIVVSPTISIGYRLWPDDGRREARTDVLRAMLDAGCRIAMSTDCGIPNVPHDAYADALEIVQEMSGLASHDVLKLATSEAAELLGMPDRGVIAPGKRADLVVVEGDPTVDLGALKRVRMVVAGGAVFAGPFARNPAAS